MEQAMSDSPERLNVLFVTPWYPSEVAPVYGIFIREHALAVQLYHDVTVVCSDEIPGLAQRELQETVDYGLPTLRYRFRPTPSRLGKQFWRAWGAWRVSRLLKRRGYRPHIIHANVGSSMLAALVLRRAFGAPVVLTEHATIYQSDQLGRFMRWYVRNVSNRAARVMPVTANLAERLRYHGVRVPMQVVPNALDLGIFQFQQRPDHHHKKTWQLVSAGLLIERKGHLLTIEAVAKLRERGRDVRLDIMGEGEQRSLIEQRVEALGLGDHVTLHGNVPKAEVARMMRVSDIFVLATYYETQGCVFFEALASGIPVVGTQVGGVPEVVGPDHGILVPPGDVNALTEAIDQVMSNYASYDPQALADYAHGRYAHKVVGAQFDAIYREVLAGG
jgi:glycosyltransferase involved in cell wall biosynthesis